MRSYVLFLCFLPCALSCSSTAPFLRFHKIKSCYRSTLPVISSKNLNHVTNCMKYARDKKGLAFNYSPPDLQTTNKHLWHRNCQVLACPEVGNSTTLEFDPLFDYYSAYGDSNVTANATCIKSVGLFQLVAQKNHYFDAALFCQAMGAELADVLSESRTTGLAKLLKSMKSWYKAAYVGLEDTEVEGSFESPMGNSLGCTKYRAWAVGHPRPHRKRDDCVVLDADKTWRAIDCKIKLGFICEFFPAPPETEQADCTKITNPRRKKQCLALFELIKNSSRADQCALINGPEENAP